MRIYIKLMVLALAVMFQTSTTQAQPARQLINILISPDRPDWNYHIGEKADFKVSVFKNDYLLQNVKVEYCVFPEGMNTDQDKTIVLKDGSGTIKGGTMNEPGFLRCAVKVEYEGKFYEKYAQAGFDVDKIAPTTTLPYDFEAFWQKWKGELAKIPVDPILTLIPSRCTDKVDVYHISMQNIEGKIYGILCKPKKEGKYPAILYVPGAGVSAKYGNPWGVEKGVITLEIGIHGIPVDLESSVYEDLEAGSLKNYFTFSMDDKDEYYYKRVYLGCVRAVDFIFSLPFFDKQNLAVTGGSQGGALSIVTTALDNRVSCLAALCPALCDLTGYTKGRVGGWPQLPGTNTQLPERIETSRYYDVVNFARFIKVPGWYSWGYNDNICPPTTIFSAYNVITAPKEKHIFLDAQHWYYPEQLAQRKDWIYELLLK